MGSSVSHIKTVQYNMICTIQRCTDRKYKDYEDNETSSRTGYKLSNSVHTKSMHHLTKPSYKHRPHCNRNWLQILSVRTRHLGVPRGWPRHLWDFERAIWSNATKSFVDNRKNENAMNKPVHQLNSWRRLSYCLGLTQRGESWLLQKK